jgi:hypothetical protein
MGLPSAVEMNLMSLAGSRQEAKSQALLRSDPGVAGLACPGRPLVGVTISRDVRRVHDTGEPPARADTERTQAPDLRLNPERQGPEFSDRNRGPGQCPFTDLESSRSMGVKRIPRIPAGVSGFP